MHFTVTEFVILVLGADEHGGRVDVLGDTSTDALLDRSPTNYLQFGYFMRFFISVSQFSMTKFEFC